MLSNLLASASTVAFLLVTSASAQQLAQKAKLLSPIKNAGIYHVATGTWSRNSGQQANLGPDIVYRNDAQSGYFGFGWAGAQAVDEGILPGTNNPFLGPQDSYLINGLSFSYCASGAGPGIVWDFFLYDSYVPCDRPDKPEHCINLVWTMGTNALPRNTACWLVTFDLTGGAEACLVADGGPCAPGYQGLQSGRDGFGFGVCWDNSNKLAGPVLSGDPNWAHRGDGTCYQPFTACPGQGTGLGERDFIGVSAPLGGCFWFGGYLKNKPCGGSFGGPSASFDHTLFADCKRHCAPLLCHSIACDEFWDPDNTARIDIDACDASSDNRLIVSLDNAKPDKLAYLLLSKNRGQVSPPGAKGSLCVAAPIARYRQDSFKTDANGNGSMDLMNAITGGGGGNVPLLGGNIVGGTWNAQYWFRRLAGNSGFSSLATFGPVQ